MTTTPPATPETELLLESLAEELTTINAHLEKLTERKQALTAAILDLIPAGTTTPAGLHTITVTTPTRRLNSRKLTEAFPADKYPDLYVRTLDTKAVKKAFSENALTEGDFYTIGSPTVRLS